MKIKEPFNASSHLIGAIGVGIAALVLIVLNWGDWKAVGVFSVYLLCNVALFTASTLYHWLDKVSTGLRKFDHSAIYLMIAGTYTPIASYALPRKIGIPIIVSQWILCAVGLISTLFMQKPPTWLRLVLYLAMGWMIAPFSGYVVQSVGGNVVAWMVAGGIIYTVGAVIYSAKKPNLWPGKFGFHELWHCFVLGGAFCHAAMMFGLSFKLS